MPISDSCCPCFGVRNENYIQTCTMKLLPQSFKRNLSEGVIISDLVFMNIVQVKWILVYDVKWGANFFYIYMCSYSHIRLYIHTHTHFLGYFYWSHHFLIVHSWCFCQKYQHTPTAYTNFGVLHVFFFCCLCLFIQAQAFWIMVALW